jgi:hypothetical protein
MTKNNALKLHVKAVLRQLIDLLHQLDHDTYTQPLPLLSGASMGGHTRHIIELFEQLLQGYAVGEVNYDQRARDLRLQTDLNEAIERCAQLIAGIDLADKPLLLMTAFQGEQVQLPSTYARELLYNLEHCVHHQALLKVGLLACDMAVVNEDFGVASATLAYRQGQQNGSKELVASGD